MNSVVSVAGHAGESYYMIVSGTVDVMIEGEGGVLKCVNVMKSGQGFGEIALVNKVGVRPLVELCVVQ